MSIRRIARELYGRYVRGNSLQVLRERGLIVGRNFNMQQDVIIDASHCWHIRIGDDVTLAPRVHILAHDASTKEHLGYTRIGKVTIGDRVFIGASAVVLPGVSIGDDAVIGAGSIVSRNVPPRVVAAGNPCKVLCSLEDFLARKRTEMEALPCFGDEFTIERNVSDERKAEMTARMKDGYGYVV